MICVAVVKASSSPDLEDYHIFEYYVTGSQDVIRLTLFVVVHGVVEPICT